MRATITALTAVVVSVTLPAFADGPWASVQVTNAWSGSTNTRPAYYDNPKDLADEGHLLDYGEKTSLATFDDDDVYMWEEPEAVDYTWILFTFPDNDWDLEQAYVDWSFWVEEEGDDGLDDFNKLCYWWPGDGGAPAQFIEIGMAPRDSDGKNINWALGAWINNGDAENVTFLIYGYTPYPLEMWAKCDLAMARVQFSEP